MKAGRLLKNDRSIFQSEYFSGPVTDGLVLCDAALVRSAIGIITSALGCAGMRCMAMLAL
jgi:hypothetical protein